MTRLAIDFEYRDHKEARMTLVACSTQIEGEAPISWWLHDDFDAQLRLAEYLERHEDKVMISYGATAEAECFIGLGLNPRRFVWHDLHTDFLQVQNGSPTWNHGVFWKYAQPRVKTCCGDAECECVTKAYVRAGPKSWSKQYSVPVVVEEGTEWDDSTLVEGVNIRWWKPKGFGFSVPKAVILHPWGESFEKRRKVEDKAYEMVSRIIKSKGWSAEPIKANLLNAALRLCGIERDPAAKDAARDIILGNKTYTPEQRAVIEGYAGDDTADLFAMDDKLHAIIKAQTQWDDDEIEKARRWRGRSAANHAHLVREGLRLHEGRLANLRANRMQVFGKAYERWNATVMPTFSWCPKEGRWKRPTNAVNAFIAKVCADNGITDWEKTVRGYSTSNKAGDALDRYADLVSAWNGKECEYDADGPLKGFQRFGKLASSLNSIPAPGIGAEGEAGDDGLEDEVTMLSFLGADFKLRPYFGTYGTQTARNAPKATGFLPAKSAWLRALVDPEPGYAYVELDYSSQETFIAGAISGDEGILRAYNPQGPTKGDAYLAFALDAHLITQDEYADYMAGGEASKKVKSVRKLCKAIVLGCFDANTLVLTKTGWKPIPKITEEDYLWDGIDWVKSKGSKPMGVKEVINVAGIQCTPEHDFWINGEWQEARHLGWDVLVENSRRLPGAGADWAEVWQLVRNLGRSANSIKVSVCALLRRALGK